MADDPLPHNPELKIQLAFDVGEPRLGATTFYVANCCITLFFGLQNVVKRCLRQCRTLRNKRRGKQLAVCRHGPGEGGGKGGSTMFANADSCKCIYI